MFRRPEARKKGGAGEEELSSWWEGKEGGWKEGTEGRNWDSIKGWREGRKGKETVLGSKGETVREVEK